MSSSRNSQEQQQPDQITHVINRDKKSLSDHGQKLFNAINCFLDDEEQRLLTVSLFKYQKDHNVFTLVRSCREIFDTNRKKSLMLFMRPVIPIRDRFHYDEYYKLFFPEEFQNKDNSRSIFAELIPKELVEKTIEKANSKAAKKSESLPSTATTEDTAAAVVTAIESASASYITKKTLDLNIDLSKIISDNGHENALKDELNESSIVKIAGFRIIEIRPEENESLGFSVCLGPTQTFIMVSYVEAGSQVEKLGMKVGDELVSVNEISLKMTSVEDAIDILSSFDYLHIVLQTSGFMPEDCDEQQLQDAFIKQIAANQDNYDGGDICWLDPFDLPIPYPVEVPNYLQSHVRLIKFKFSKKRLLSEIDNIGMCIRGGFEYELGIFVASIQPNSVAAKSGLKIGDQILSVNNQSFAHITLLNAMDVFKAGLKLAFINTTNETRDNEIACLNMCVRYIGKLPSNLYNPFKDINLNCLLITNNSELKKRCDQRNINLKLNLFYKHLNSINKMFKNFNLKQTQFNEIKFYVIEYIKFNLTLDYLIHLFKLHLKNHVEIAESLRDYIYQWELEFYDAYIFDLKFSLLSLRSKNLKKQINYENLEKPETLFRVDCLKVKSDDDLNKNIEYLFDDDDEDELQQRGSINKRYNNSNRLNKNQPVRKYIYRSKSLDNLNYFLNDDVYNKRVNVNQKKELDEKTINNMMQNFKVPSMITIEKRKTTLGIVIYGGINTKELIPRIVSVLPNGCAHSKLKEGQLILDIDRISVIGLTYRQIVKLLNDSFKNKKKKDLDFIIAEPIG